MFMIRSPRVPEFQSSKVQKFKRSTVRGFDELLNLGTLELWNLLHLFHIPYFRRESFEHRLHAGVGHRLGTKLGLPVRWRRCRAGGRVRSGILLHGGYRDLAAARPPWRPPPPN